MLQEEMEEMEETDHSILCSSLSLIGELKGLQKQGLLLLFPTWWEFCKCNVFHSRVSVLLEHVLRRRSSAPFLRCDLVLELYLACVDAADVVHPSLKRGWGLRDPVGADHSALQGTHGYSHSSQELLFGNA